MTHRSSRVNCHNDSTLEDEGQRCGSLISGWLPVLKSIILLSSPPECLMFEQNS